MKIGYLMQDGVVDIRHLPPSGPAVHVIQVINELKNLGNQVILIVKFGGNIYRSDDLLTFELVPVSVFDAGPLRLFEKVVRRIQSLLRLPYANLFESLRFAMACRRELSDCNIFYERFGWIGYGGWLAASFLKIPIVWEMNGDHLAELESHGYVLRGAQKWLSSSIMRGVAKRINFTVATGNGWRQKYISRWNIDPSKISVIENGSLVVDYLHRGDLMAFRDNQQTTDCIKIVYVGAFEPWHGIHILLDAVSLAIQTQPRLHLYLIGDGPEKDRIIQLISTHNLNDVVDLLGHLDLYDVITYLKTAEVGVSPYCGRAEYSGLKLLDYKGAGLAIIASGVDGQPDVLDHGRTGWIVPPCDVEALSNAIVYLSMNASLRKSLGQKARLEAEKFHRWRHTAEKLEYIFKQLIVSSDN